MVALVKKHRFHHRFTTAKQNQVAALALSLYPKYKKTGLCVEVAFAKAIHNKSF
jgi:hypothetical protein